MLNRIVSLTLVLALSSSSSLFAADFNTSIEKAVRAEVQQANARASRRMPGVYKWVGIGLLINGSVTLVTTLALYGEESSTCDNLGSNSCDTFRNIFYADAIVSLVAGAVVLGIGAKKRAPSLTFHKGGWTLQKRITF